MTSPSYSILFSAKVDGSASAGSAGDVLIPDTTSGEYVKATTANRGTRRSTGIALTTYVADGTVEIQQTGVVSTSITGLGAGSVSWVRTSATGTCERCTPGAGDDLLGKCDALGNLFLQPGTWDSSNYAGGGGGGGGTPGGSNTQVQYNNSSAFGGISGVTTDGVGLTALKLKDSSGGQYYTFAFSDLAADRTVTLPLLGASDTFVFEAHTQTLTNKTISGASNTISNLAASAIASGTLVHERGGLEADVSAYSGWVKISAGATSAVAVAAAVETWAVTPSGANLGSALTSALTAAKGGTGIDTSATTGVPKIAAGTWSSFALGTGVETFLTTPSGANLASALTTAMPVSKGGTNRTALGTANQVLRTNGTATDTEWATVSATPAGASGDIQTNNAGSFGSLTPGTGVSTWLATPSSANLAAAVTGETGSGALVFGTGPTISAPVLTGVTRFSGVTTNASTGTLNNVALSGNPILDFTNATGPTVTGIDATGISAGQIIFVICTGGTMALNHEDAGSTAANRIVSGSGASVSVAVNMVVPLFYYGSRWHVMATNAI